VSAGARLDGKVVVVTGAARGQGAAEVTALAAAGASVVATDVLDDEGSALVAGLPGDVSYRHLDVRDAAAWAALATSLRERYGRVDALVNNAGVAARERLPDVTPEGWQQAFDVNVTGPLLGIQPLVPLMPRLGPGVLTLTEREETISSRAMARTRTNARRRPSARKHAIHGDGRIALGPDRVASCESGEVTPGHDNARIAQKTRDPGEQASPFGRRLL